MSTPQLILDVVNTKNTAYSTAKIYWVKCVYVVAAVIWSIIVCHFSLFASTAAVILWLPLILFGIAYFNVGNLSEEVHDDVLKSSFISIGLMLSLPLLGWLNKDYQGDKNHVTETIVIAMILTLFSLLHVWVSKKWIPVWNHAKSALETMSLSLFVYALVSYFLVKRIAGTP